MVNIHGKVLGKCYSAPEQTFYCSAGVSQVIETRMLDCESSLTQKDFSSRY